MTNRAMCANVDVDGNYPSKGGRGELEVLELVRDTWRNLEEFQLSSTLALEALFIELRRAFAGVAA